jgi:prepilin-type N-terminal cleavage/methylation domain-containing protein
LPRRVDGGFTLLEVLVALVILSGTLLLCYRVATSSLGTIADGEDSYRAALLGEATVLMHLAPFPDTGRTEGTFPSPDESFRYSLEVAEAAHKDVRELHAVVAWESPLGERRVDVPGIAVR